MNTIYRVTTAKSGRTIDVGLEDLYASFKEARSNSEVTLEQFQQDAVTPTLQCLLGVTVEKVDDPLEAVWDAEVTSRNAAHAAARDKALWKRVTVAALEAGTPVSKLLEDSVLTPTTIEKWAADLGLSDEVMARVKDECNQWRWDAPKRAKAAAISKRLRKFAA